MYEFCSFSTTKLRLPDWDLKTLPQQLINGRHTLFWKHIDLHTTNDNIIQVNVSNSFSRSLPRLLDSMASMISLALTFSAFVVGESSTLRFNDLNRSFGVVGLPGSMIFRLFPALSVDSSSSPDSSSPPDSIFPTLFRLHLPRVLHSRTSSASRTSSQ